MTGSRILRGAILSGALALTAASAQAQSVSSCDGRNESSTFYQSAYNIYTHGGDHLSGETTTFTVAGDFTLLNIQVQGGATVCSSATTCNGASFTAPSDGNYVFEISGIGAGGATTIGPNSPQASPRVATAAVVAGDVGSSCAAPATPSQGGSLDLDGDGFVTAADVLIVINAINGSTTVNRMQLTPQDALALINYINEHGPGAVASKDRLTFATAGEGGLTGDGWALWGSVQGYRFDGRADGDAIALTFGGDFAIGDSARLGLMVDYGIYDITYGGFAASAEALSYGPYLSLDLGPRFKLDAFAAFASPDYAIAGTSFDTNRRSGGLTLSTDYMLGAVELTSFASVSGFVEDHPAVTLGGTPVAAHSVSSLTGSLGSKAMFNPGQAARPYLSVAAEFNQFDDGLGTTLDHFAPRFGAGIEVNGEMGNFEFRVETGEIIEGTRDYSARFGYSLEF